ncbi:MAG: hypothetical protein V4760_19255 [Bdellovibrionota bacterium]
MSRNMDVALKIAEKHQDREMNSRIAAKMRASVQDAGHVDGLRATILRRVASEQYDGAVEDIKNYIDAKSEYPQFKSRSERYLNYAVDLVNAVKAKRSFPGMQHLSMSKQQELFDRAMEHFEDLKVTLKKVEQIETEVRLDDVRSTVYVIKALVYCVFGLLVLAFLLEVSRGVLPAAAIVVDDSFGSIINFIFDKIGF